MRSEFLSETSCRSTTQKMGRQRTCCRPFLALRWLFFNSENRALRVVQAVAEWEQHGHFLCIVIAVAGKNTFAVITFVAVTRKIQIRRVVAQFQRKRLGKFPARVGAAEQKRRKSDAALKNESGRDSLRNLQNMIDFRMQIVPFIYFSHVIMMVAIYCKIHKII